MSGVLEQLLSIQGSFGRIAPGNIAAQFQLGEEQLYRSMIQFDKFLLVLFSTRTLVLCPLDDKVDLYNIRLSFGSELSLVNGPDGIEILIQMLNGLEIDLFGAGIDHDVGVAA